MKYIEVIADANDGDMVTEMTKVDDDINFELLMMMFKTVKLAGGDFTTCDQGNGGVELLRENRFDDDDINMFFDFVPYHEYGIHTIETIRIYDVKDVIEYM